jgi:hypothetical protein
MEQRSDASATPEPDLTNEETLRAMVQAMCETPDGRKALKAFFSLTNAGPGTSSKVDDYDPVAANAQIVAWIREQFPNAPEDTAEWDGWPA